MMESHKVFWKKDFAVPRFISGTNWYIEPFLDGLEVQENMDAVDWGEVLATMHKELPIDWYDKHREIKYEKWPALKKAPKGSHIWEFTCRSEWFELYKDFHAFWISAGYEPLSEAGKRIVTTHGDFHSGNVLLDKNMKVYGIDFEFTNVSWAINDIGYVFSNKDFKCWNYENKSKFCKRYLEVLGLPNDKENVDLLIYDAECHGLLRIFHSSKLTKDLEETLKKPDYDFKLYKILERFEAKSRTDKSLITKIAENNFEDAAKQEFEEVKEYTKF